MRLIDGNALYEKACDLEAQALDYTVKISNDKEKREEWLRWSAILAERTAFKHDVYDAPTIEPGPQWIPCSERLPEDKTAYYLATIANHGLFFTTTLNNNVECVRWDYDRRKGQDSWHWCTERTVIAWMPLPEPYREEGEK